MLINRRPLAAVLIVAVLIFAGCSDDSQAAEHQVFDEASFPSGVRVVEEYVEGGDLVLNVEFDAPVSVAEVSFVGEVFRSETTNTGGSYVAFVDVKDPTDSDKVCEVTFALEDEYSVEARNARVLIACGVPP